MQKVLALNICLHQKKMISLSTWANSSKKKCLTNRCYLRWFVTTENEIKGDKNKPPRDGLKKMIHDFIGPQAYNVIKGIVKPDKNGQMSIDKSGSNK